MKPAIVMQTDFVKGISTCTMDGVIQCIDPELRSYDCTHDIPPFDIYTASYNLNFVVEFWPKGTVFVSVVDPGVGTSRRACVAKLSNGSYVVAPDNGTLTHMKKYFGIEAVRIIDETKNRLETTRDVSIFHGRDLFAYCAAKLAAGIIDFEGVGPEYPVDEILELKIIEPKFEDGVITGMIESSDFHFGLVSSNIPHQMMEKIGVKHGDKVLCTVLRNGQSRYSEIIPFAPSFGYVPKKAALVMVSETRTLEIAKNQANISEEFGIGCGPDWTIAFKKAEAD